MKSMFLQVSNKLEKIKMKRDGHSWKWVGSGIKSRQHKPGEMHSLTDELINWETP